jgi:succinoglycan biosynthesis transport protein ExoP
MTAAELFSRVWLRPKVVGAFVLAALIAAALYLQSAPRLYEASTQLLIEPRSVSVLEPQLFSGVPIENAAIESQIQILRSRELARRVVGDLQLAKDAEFVGEGAEPRSSDAAERAAIRLQHMAVIRRIGLSYVIEVTARSRHPEKAAEIANAVARAYVQGVVETKSRIADWMVERIGDLDHQVRSAEQEVEEFIQGNRIVGEAGQTIYEQQLNEATTQLMEARGQVAEAKARLDWINKVLASGNPEALVADATTNEIITSLRSDYLEIQRREQELAEQLGDSHSAVIAAREQMEKLQAAMRDELRRIAQTYESDYQIALLREQTLDEQVDARVSASVEADRAARKLGDLRAALENLKALRDGFRAKYVEALQNATFPLSDARIVSPAAVPLQPAAPRPLPILLVSIGLGLASGVLAAGLLEYSRAPIRSCADLETLLGLRCLGVVPRHRRGAKRIVQTFKSAVTGGSSKEKGGVSAASELALQRAIRSIRFRLSLNHPARNRVIGITSINPREGKTTIALGLAEAIAENGDEVLVIDYNRDRRDALLAGDEGQSSATAATNVKALAVRDAIGRLNYLSVQKNMDRLDDLTHSELFTANGIRLILTEARLVYKYVLVDLPAINETVEVGDLSTHFDEVLLVVENGRTTIKSVVDSVLTDVFLKGKISSAVLNKGTDQQWL